MRKQERIQKWLEQKNYWEGVLIFNEYSNNRHLKRKFKQGPGNYNTPKLQQELEHIASRELVKNNPKIMSINSSVFVPPKKKQGKRATTPFPESKKKAPIEFNKLPFRLQTRVLEKSDLFRKMDYLHKRLDLMPTQEERLRAILDIVALDKGIKKIWKEIDYYNETGKFLDEEEKSKQSAPRTLVENEIELFKERQRLRVQVSKQKDNPVRQEEVKKWNARIAEIDLKLKT